MSLYKSINRRKVAFIILFILAICVLSVDSFAPNKDVAIYKNYVANNNDTGINRNDVGINRNDAIIGKQPRTVRCYYYNEKNFDKSTKLAEQIGRKDVGVVYGGIVPHHLVAAPMIADFFRQINSTNFNTNGTDTKTDCINTIYILGPNHKRVGEAVVQTVDMDWDTPFGLMNADKLSINEISKKISTQHNPSLLEQEHSVSALVPYAKYYFSNANIVPILLPGSMDYQQCLKLAQIIKKEASKGSALVVASIDFSHYLTPEEAINNDKHTLKLIEDFDYEAIMRLNNDYLDAPQVLVTFLKIMELQQTMTLTELDHKEASSFIGEYTKETTSYFTMLFSR